jgi:hypothetical protein
VTRAYAVAFVVLLAVGGGLLWWRHRAAPVAPPPPPPPVLAPAGPPAAPPPPPPPAIRHPLPSSPGAPPSLDGSDAFVENALAELLGRKKVRELLHLDGAVRRFVATVNNLATDDASASLWPVKTTPGKLETAPGGGGLTIAAGNAERYAPFVHLAAGLDARRAVALYVRLYPLLQQAYEDLGYPGKYFNDRVVEVIDNLLATPAPAGPLAVKRFAADGSSSGSGLYVYEDPALEACTAGQKILLRMGAENAEVLEAKLREIRAQLVARPPATR